MSLAELSMENLKLFKQSQDMAFGAATYARSKLQVGMTEKEAALLMEDYLTQNGIKQYFHRPFAWFGDRTKFHNFSWPLAFMQKKTHHKLGLFKNPLGGIPHFGLEFLPSNTKLEKDMAVILDVAPSLHGAASDIGYSYFNGESSEFNSVMAFLDNLKKEIPSLIYPNIKISELYQKVEEKIQAKGLENCHQIYPLGVLGHRVGLLPLRKFPRINILGFHPQAFFFLLKQDAKALFRHSEKSPFIEATNDHPLTDGLWAIEPHVGTNEFGAKFEEILVVQNGKASWLSDIFA